jgi:predicted esterase
MRQVLRVFAIVLLAACDNGTSGDSQTPRGANDGSKGPGSNPGSSGDSGSSGSGGGASDSGSGASSDPDASSGTNPSDSGVAPVDAGVPSDSDGGAPSFLPPVNGTCPTLATGVLSFAGQQVQIWAATAPSSTPGSLVIFWHGTGGNATDALYLFGQQQISAVTGHGGIVASISTSNRQGTDTGNGVWYTGDFDTADQIVACALQQTRIDQRRIYTAGDSAGGLQATWMAYARSGYIAAVATLSGGLAGQNGFYAAPVNSPQDPSNVPSALVTHGAQGSDVVIMDFAVASAAYEANIKSKGGFSIDCNTGGGHVSGPPQICPAMWQFFEDHPYGVKDRYPSGLPSVYPSYCRVGPRLADGGTP